MTLQNICHPRSGSSGRVRTCGLINHNLCTRLNHQNSLCSRGYLGTKSRWYTGSPHHWPRFPKAQKDIVDVEATILEGRNFETNRCPKRSKNPISIPCPWSVTKCAYLSFPRSTMADIMVMRTTKLL